MPQITKGGKFVFGWSIIHNSKNIKIPQQAYDEYKLMDAEKVILISGSKKTGGFCISNRTMIENSNIKGLFEQNPLLYDYKTNEGEFIKYKGRLYCWISLNKNLIKLNDAILKTLDLKIGDKLLSIRGSDIAFVMGVKGPLIERATQSEKEIEMN